MTLLVEIVHIIIIEESKPIFREIEFPFHRAVKHFTKYVLFFSIASNAYTRP